MSEINRALPTSFNINNKYLDTLVNTVSNECMNVNETDLAAKLVLALYIRIGLERLLYLTYCKNTNNKPVINTYNKTVDLINKTKQYFSDTDSKNILKANIISPAFVHVNSFMLEPLVDASAHELVDLAKWLMQMNSSLNYNAIRSLLPNNGN